ncbi:MAG: excalibur calcium-binding domain-containing protein, partial [Actinobacteria bacterium]|nr:excalibur calcium-binding domain-containing protein [Actinomycetota bacterium]
LNLLAVDALANREESDGDAATWLPSNKSFRCSYVARQIAVKKKYELWVTASEAEAMRGILSACPDQRVPAPGAQPTIASNTGGQAPPSGTSGGDSDSPLYFRNCTDARAAGAAPIRRGTPAYEPNMHLDGDSDGIACE